MKYHYKNLTVEEYKEAYDSYKGSNRVMRINGQNVYKFDLYLDELCEAKLIRERDSKIDEILK